MPAGKRAAPSASASLASDNDNNNRNWKKRKQERAFNARFIQTQQPNHITAAATTTTNNASTTNPTASSFVPSASGSANASTLSSSNAAAATDSPLPAQLDLEAAIASRSFEINSFLKSLKTAKSANATRAWQLLPRHARRRAASHNLLRLPSRLRNKAQMELDASNTTAKTKSEIRKKLPSHGVIQSNLRRSKLASRAAHPQRRWLETHLWHAKRFRMTIDKGKRKELDQGVCKSRWGFVLPETTMNKSHKASWRSALERITIHDASYYSAFRISVEMHVEQDTGPDDDENVQVIRNGLTKLLQNILEEAGFVDGWDKEEWTNGSVACETVLSGHSSRATSSFPSNDSENQAMKLDQHPIPPTASSSTSTTNYAALAPVRILWLPQLLRFVRSGPSNSQTKNHRHKAETETETNVSETNETSDSITEKEPTSMQTNQHFLCRELIILVHPAAEAEVKNALQGPAGLTITSHSKDLFDKSTSIGETVIRSTQLQSAPDPWLAAGGKDSGTSKHKKKTPRQKIAQDIRTANQSYLQPTVQNTLWTRLDSEMDRQRDKGFNIFELLGPDSGRLLASVLKLCKRSSCGSDVDAESDAVIAMSFLKQQQGKGKGTDKDKGGASKHGTGKNDQPKHGTGKDDQPKHDGIPDGVVLSFEIHDPRLSFPPKSTTSSSSLQNRHGQVNLKPNSKLSSSRLLAFGMHSPNYSKGEIDSRRAKQPVPCSRLEPDSSDNVIPVVVVKRKIVPGKVEGFTLFVPRHWSLAFFLSLVNTHQSGSSQGARVLGQHQLRHQSLELCAMSESSKTRNRIESLFFPTDWVGTRSYIEMEEEASQLRKEEWQKRPKGKRIEFDYATRDAFGNPSLKEKTLTKLAHDRTGAARPFPFGGVRIWSWVLENSFNLFGAKPTDEVTRLEPWLCSIQALLERNNRSLDSTNNTATTTVALADTTTNLQKLESMVSSLNASMYNSALIAVKLYAIRKGSLDELSSVMLPATYEDHLSWIEHVDVVRHPLYRDNCSRSFADGTKLDKAILKAEIDRRFEALQLGSAAPNASSDSTPLTNLFSLTSSQTDTQVDPPSAEEIHDRSANWNHTIGVVIHGDYSLGNGKGFGIAALSLRAWIELQRREQRRLESDHQLLEQQFTAKHRQKRNPISVSNLVLVRQVGTDVLRPAHAVVVHL